MLVVNDSAGANSMANQAPEIRTEGMTSNSMVKLVDSSAPVNL